MYSSKPGAWAVGGGARTHGRLFRRFVISFRGVLGTRKTRRKDNVCGWLFFFSLFLIVLISRQASILLIGWGCLKFARRFNEALTNLQQCKYDEWLMLDSDTETLMAIFSFSDWLFAPAMIDCNVVQLRATFSSWYCEKKISGQTRRLVLIFHSSHLNGEFLLMRRINGRSFVRPWTFDRSNNCCLYLILGAR